MDTYEFQTNGFKIETELVDEAKKLITDGGPEANYAHFYLQR